MIARGSIDRNLSMQSSIGKNKNSKLFLSSLRKVCLMKKVVFSKYTYGCGGIRGTDSV